MTLPTYILGAGGHGAVVADCLVAMGRTIRGFVDVDSKLWGMIIGGVPVLGGDAVIFAEKASAVELANGIGSIGSLERRKRVYKHWQAKGYRFVTIVHPRAIISPLVLLEEGTQIMAGAIVQTNVQIGENSIVNTGAIVDHDCIIGPHCHLAPGCTLSGNVKIGESTHVGTGASIIQGIEIGAAVLVGAGAAVVNNIPDAKCVTGVPAKEKNES